MVQAHFLLDLPDPQDPQDPRDHQAPKDPAPKDPQDLQVMVKENVHFLLLFLVMERARSKSAHSVRLDHWG